MPIHLALRSPLPLKLLCRTVLSIKRTEEIDLKFLKDIVSDQKCPEFNGYNTKVIRESDAQLKPATTSVYRPLIDMTPAHPDTIMTALVEAQYQRLVRK